MADFAGDFLAFFDSKARVGLLKFGIEKYIEASLDGAERSKLIDELLGVAIEIAYKRSIGNSLRVDDMDSMPGPPALIRCTLSKVSQGIGGAPVGISDR